MGDIKPISYKLHGGIAVVEGLAARDVTFGTTENGRVLGLPGSVKVKILLEKDSGAQEGAVSKNESIKKTTDSMTMPNRMMSKELIKS
jgi:hypothetical protein